MCICKTNRLPISVHAKHSDMLLLEQGDTVHEGYGLDGSVVGEGGSDYLIFSYCPECGRIQGEFPIPDLQQMIESDSD